VFVAIPLTSPWDFCFRKGWGVKEHLWYGFAIKQVLKHILMFLNNLLKVGSGIVKVSIGTVKVATPIVGSISHATVKFARREAALGKREATVQSDLIKASYTDMKEATKLAKANIMEAFDMDVLPEEDEAVEAEVALA
jgi:uncharacterized protein (DUF697 family)